MDERDDATNRILAELSELGARLSRVERRLDELDASAVETALAEAAAESGGEGGAAPAAERAASGAAGGELWVFDGEVEGAARVGASLGACRADTRDDAAAVVELRNFAEAGGSDYAVEDYTITRRTASDGTLELVARDAAGAYVGETYRDVLFAVRRLTPDASGVTRPTLEWVRLRAAEPQGGGAQLGLRVFCTGVTLGQTGLEVWYATEEVRHGVIVNYWDDGVYARDSQLDPPRRIAPNPQIIPFDACAADEFET